MLNILDYHNPIPIPGKLNVWPFQAERNPSLIESMLRHREGSSKRLYARSLKIQEISPQQARSFLDQNHLNGGTNGAKHCYALCFKDEPILVITLGIPRYTNSFKLEVLRLASKQNTTVIGGASRLFSFINRVHAEQSILTYSDLLLGNGEVYRAAGFMQLGATRPGYFWEKDGKILQRHQTQKSRLNKILGEDIDLTLSERTLMMQAGWWKVEDLGHLRWGLGPQHDSEALRKKFHFLYRITRPSIDDSFYIGIHSTDRINDGYMGSGDIISASVNKHGVALHERKIIQFFENRAEVLTAEKEIVTNELLADPRCMNICLGGGTFLQHIGSTTGRISLWHENGNERKVNKEEVDIFVSRGWHLGRHPRNKKHLHGKWFIREDGSQGRSSELIPDGATLGKNPSTFGKHWVIRDGRQILVDDVLLTDTKGYFPEKTNKGKVVRIRDGVRKLYTKEEAEELNDCEVVTPPTLGKIGMRSPTGIKKLVSPDEARKLVKENWVLATKQLKSAPPQVLELAAELGMKLPKKRINKE